MITQNKVVLLILLVLNAIVLLGQLWPEGAPPFAGAVNILTLLCNVLFFLILVRKNKTSD